MAAFGMKLNLVSWVIYGSLLVASMGYASGNFVVSTPTDVQNGSPANVINGSSSLYITPTGSITVSGIDAVIVIGTFNVVNNEGVLTALTTGSGMDSSSNANVLINAGTINAQGVFPGILVETSFNTVVNAGVINSNFTNISLAGSNNLGINTGIINNSGSSGFGLTTLVGFKGALINTGKILMAGDSASDLSVTGISDFVLVNTGSVIATGASSQGIVISSSNRGTINNKGSVIVTGTGSDAIFLEDTSSAVTNSGKVVSVQGNAFNFQGASPSAPIALVLKPESFIGGVISLGTATAVTIKTGASQSVLWDLSTGTMLGGAPVITGAVPSFYDPTTKQFATYDPTGQSALRDELADVSAATSLMIQTRLDGSCDASCRGNVWVSTFGSTYKYDGSGAILGYHSKYWGVGIGYDQLFWGDLLLGGMVGYGHGYYDAHSRFSPSWNTDADGAIAALYGRYDLNLFFVDVGVTFGTLEHSDRRFVNDNLVPFGDSSAHSKYDSIWVCPEVAFGADINFCDKWSLMPNVRYRDAYESVHSHRESGSAANASISHQSLTVGELKTELAVKGQGPCGCFLGRVGYLYRSHMHKNNATVAILGQTQRMPSFYQNRNAGYLGLDIQFNIGYATMLNIGGEGTYGDGIRGIRGEAALIRSF